MEFVNLQRILQELWIKFPFLVKLLQLCGGSGTFRYKIWVLYIQINCNNLPK